MDGQSGERSKDMNILIIDDDWELCTLIKRGVLTEDIEAVFVIPEKKDWKN